jgi:hypothetical protein
MKLSLMIKDKVKLRRRQPVTLFREAWVWSEREEKLYRKLCVGKTLHVCCGRSRLGDVRVDVSFRPDVKASMYNLPFTSFSFDTVISDPPWFNPKTWNQFENYMRELCRVAKRRIILISGNMYYLVPKPFKLSHIYVVKKISPQAKLVYVWDRKDNLITSY